MNTEDATLIQTPTCQMILKILKGKRWADMDWRPGWRPKAEQFRNIDVNRLRKAGLLVCVILGRLVRTVDGEKVASISMRAPKPVRWCWSTGSNRTEATGRIVEEPIPLTETDRHYGGARPWFWCPAYRNGRYCGRRVGKLFLGQKYSVCRHCLRLAYSSRRKNPCTVTTAAPTRYAWRWAGNPARATRRPASRRECTGAPIGGRWMRLRRRMQRGI